jgi:hypothetical protein
MSISTTPVYTQLTPLNSNQPEANSYQPQPLFRYDSELNMYVEVPLQSRIIPNEFLSSPSSSSSSVTLPSAQSNILNDISNTTQSQVILNNQNTPVSTKRPASGRRLIDRARKTTPKKFVQDLPPRFTFPKELVPRAIQHILTSSGKGNLMAKDFRELVRCVAEKMQNLNIM